MLCVAKMGRQINWHKNIGNVTILKKFVNKYVAVL